MEEGKCPEGETDIGTDMTQLTKEKYCRDRS